MAIDDYNITAKQNATNERSAAARLDRPTEDALYAHYREFFQVAEMERRWNLWEDFAWDTVSTSPSQELVDAVTRAYHEELFLPDYSVSALSALRASRGRVWFVTRWAYEEGKHLLALTEWLQRSGAYTNDDLRAQSDALLREFAWEPPYLDGIAVFADALLWELKERERYRALRRLAEAAGEGVLAAVCARIQSDEEAHRDFLRRSLAIIAATYPEQVEDAARRVAAAASDSEGGDLYAAALLAELDLAPAGVSAA